MSRIDELIERLCPDGVKYKALSEVCEKATNINWLEVTTSQFSYIDLSSVGLRTHKIAHTEVIDANNAPSRARQIVHTGDVIFATTRPTQMRVCRIGEEFNGQICSTGYCVLRPRVIDGGFLLHSLGTTKFRDYLEANQTRGNYPAISDKLLLK